VKTLKMLRDHGQSQKGHYALLGYNDRMEGIQGAVLRVKLRHLDTWNAARRERAAEYRRLLANADVALPEEMAYGTPNYHLFPIFTPRRDALQNHLKAAGVSTGIHYPIPVHLQPAYHDLGYRVGDLPHSERASQETLSLPMYAELPWEALSMIARSIRQFAGLLDVP
jgi:dTDP-4-amino-4,6-dideoxygalactose transaminase